MLTTLKDLMKIAEEQKIAIGAFNTPNLETLQAVLAAAEEEGLPVIIMFAQCHETLNPLETIGPVMVELARRAKIPVCVHLDHGETIPYLEKALAIGFTSVMYDGSALSYEENVHQTKRAVSRAKEVGASVEAELGYMGARETGTGDPAAENKDKIYTDPDLASRFVKETCVDALACSFGTTHGIYLKEPSLNFEIVRQTRRLTGGIPIVMHGGSGISHGDYREAILNGVRKINYFTYLDKAGAAGVLACLKDDGSPAFFSSIASDARVAMKKQVQTILRVFAMKDYK